MNYRSNSGEPDDRGMYTHAIAIHLYPEACTGGRFIPGQRQITFVFCLCSREHAPFGFFCGGFSSTAAYDSGKRGSTFVERLCYFRGRSSPRSATRFYPGAQESFSTSLASLSASAKGVNSNFKSACCCSQTARHHTARLSLQPVAFP